VDARRGLLSGDRTGSAFTTLAATLDGRHAAMYIVCGQYTIMPDAPTITIDTASPVPAYRQIVTAMRGVLVSGQLEPGRRLPTVRELAIDLGVHHNTVAEAYRTLAAEGWLELRRRRGAMVLSRVAPRPSPAVATEFARNLRAVIAKALADGIPCCTVAEALTELARELSEEVTP